MREASVASDLVIGSGTMVPETSIRRVAGKSPAALQPVREEI
jgi:hypothetical protein